MRISDWSSDVCSSDLQPLLEWRRAQLDGAEDDEGAAVGSAGAGLLLLELIGVVRNEVPSLPVAVEHGLELVDDVGVAGGRGPDVPLQPRDLRLLGEVGGADVGGGERSEEHTSELQSLMRTSYAVFSLKKKNIK